MRLAHSFSAFAVVLGMLASPLVAQNPNVLPPPSAEIQRLARAARDADLRADWTGLLRAHAAFAALDVHGRDRAWVEYYLGYVDWRQSSLGWMGEGPAAMVALLRHSSEHLTRTLETAPEMTEARLLLAIVESILMSDPRRSADLAPRVQANVQRAVAEAPANPRVRFMRAMLSYFSPAGARVVKDSALIAWRAAAESFPDQVPSGEPEWGRAEAWAWLGGALLVDGDSAGARVALERAIADRKDFWWARDIALPQASRSRLTHRGGS